jgi:hypothetical protein
MKGFGGASPIVFGPRMLWRTGAPCGVVAPGKSLRGRPAVSHISRKTSEMPRISCTQLLKGQGVRLSLRRAAGSSGNPRNYTGNRGCGAPGHCGGDSAQIRIHYLPSIGGGDSAQIRIHYLPSIGGGDSTKGAVFPLRHSDRRALTGSSEAARAAGTRVANRPLRRRTQMANSKVQGSVSLTP